MLLIVILLLASSSETKASSVSCMSSAKMFLIAVARFDLSWKISLASAVSSALTSPFPGSLSFFIFFSAASSLCFFRFFLRFRRLFDLPKVSRLKFGVIGSSKVDFTSSLHPQTTWDWRSILILISIVTFLTAISILTETSTASVSFSSSCAPRAKNKKNPIKILAASLDRLCSSESNFFCELFSVILNLCIHDMSVYQDKG